MCTLGARRLLATDLASHPTHPKGTWYLMSQTLIPELVARLHAALAVIDFSDRDAPLTLRAPATDEQIAALAKSWGRALPASLVEFLQLANGMEGAEPGDWSIAGATPPRQFDSFDDVRDGVAYALRQKDPKHPMIKPLEGATVAGADFDRAVVFYEPARLDMPEPPLLHVSYGDEGDVADPFADFTAFLGFIVKEYEEMAEAFEDEVGGMDDGDLSDEDEALLRTIASMLGGRAPEPEPEPEPKERLSPEMQMAANLCSLVIQKLLDDELIELLEGPIIRQEIENYLLNKLIRSTSPEAAMDSWIHALSKAREVEELYGTDDELKEKMTEAFEEIYAQKGG